MESIKRFRLSVSQWVAVAILGSSATLGYAVTIPNIFSAGSPVVAADVNANFTALKNAVDGIETGSVSVAPHGFTNESSVATCIITRNYASGYAFYQTDPGAGAAGCDMVAPISLPHGRHLTRLDCTVYDNTVVNTIDTQLLRVNLNSGFVETIYNTAGSVDSVLVQILSDTTPAAAGMTTVDNATYAYWIAAPFTTSDFTSLGSEGRVYGCTVAYNTLLPN